MNLNILLVEDQAIVRQGLKIILEQDPSIRVAHEAENGRKAIEILQNHIVDVVLMDIRMPVMNGIEATREIKKQWPAIKVLILTTFNDEEYAMQALKEGANGFLLKTSESAKLLDAIYSCMNGGLTIHDEVAAKVMPRLLQRTKKENSSKAAHPFSSRELAIIKLVGEGQTNREIAEKLYLSVGTVKNHLTLILQKLDLRDRTQLAIYAVRNELSEH
ncbi:response regulator transcription factor [Jeotgalibacillus sp. ET6]|uniref:response regulator transcription factor n=1 Tax=Jeotgalibacillus sp. ET6 TaxID=3037260 RepID=UPI0024185B27|nr:response regulator transcription factor [Jeotgalibacillus sp. ET6]MDG5473553.1 response regulator transcription factor [Jeotgalibacillus sp. ET6]